MDILILTYSQSLTWLELEGFLGCLTAPRKSGVLKKKTDKDRINALLSRLLMISEISSRTGIPQKKIRFEFGSHGKPYLRDSKLQFSLSHTNGAICMAFSDTPSATEDGEIGVDIENRSRRVNPVMYKRSLSDEELERVHSSEDFIRCWVQKEAFLKRLGIGLSRDLRGISTPTLPDTAEFDVGDYIIGISGKGARDAAIKTLTADDLLSRFVKLL